MHNQSSAPEVSCVNVSLDKDELLRCWDFSTQSALHQQAVNFGQLDGADRPLRRIAENNMTGKIGELAVQKFLALKGIQTSLDFNIYERGQWDDNDIVYRGWAIDVKCTSCVSRNFLIEWHKLQFRFDEGKLPHFFLMTQMTDQAPIWGQDPFPERFRVRLIGYADTRVLQESAKDVLVLNRGDVIPRSNGAPLEAKNFCIPFEKLNTDWNSFAEQLAKEDPFSFEEYVVPGRISKKGERPKPLVSADPASPLEMPARSSVLLSGMEALKVGAPQLQSWLGAGLKVILFVAPTNVAAYSTIQSSFPRRLLVFPTSGNIPDLMVCDGQVSEQDRSGFAFLKGASGSNGFNFEQYEVEHAPLLPAVIVKASAGTGKTTVMIDRLMYLFAADEGLKPADIALITFTNKAASSMVEKLQQSLLGMYRTTGKRRWLELLEQSGSMTVSTIDSFFRNLLASEGSALGYGAGASVRSFIYDKKRIIREIIDERFRNGPGGNQLKQQILSISDYEKAIGHLWSKLHERGYFGDAFDSLDFGEADQNDASVISRNLREIVAQAEKRYAALRQESNAYSIEDIESDVERLALCGRTRLNRRSFRFLFVDEFQDTDNSQIRSIVWLQKHMGFQLFAVGDGKQSIYRFRGAEESAFAELRRQLETSNGIQPEKILEHVLTKNYRTVPDVLNPLNRLFAQWNKGREKLLEWDGALTACSSGKGKYELIDYFGREDRRAKLQSKISSLAAAAGSVCILTRTNNQVNECAEVCRNLGITFTAKLSGGFYQSDAVRDLRAMLDAVLHPDSVQSLWNLLVSSYSSRLPDPDAVLDCRGSEPLVRTYLKSLLDKSWLELIEQSRYRPAIPFIESIVDEKNPAARYGAMLRSGNPMQFAGFDDVQSEVQMYSLNLNKAMQVLYESFAGDFPSLLDIWSFLDNKVKTDKDEELVYPDASSGGSRPVQIMTVHKAKGLEFDSVIVPYLDRPFWSADGDEAWSRADVLTRRDGASIQVGWRLNKDSERSYRNRFYDLLGDFELSAVRREEARLLYVALTRAKSRLAVFVPKEQKSGCWAEYLK